MREQKKIDPGSICIQSLLIKDGAECSNLHISSQLSNHREREAADCLSIQEGCANCNKGKDIMTN